MPNANLHKAKKEKNDEFFTQYVDVEKEISAYLEYDPDVFRGKTVLLPCDDPEWSNFTKYFAQNFERFGLKKLVSTSYAVDSKKYKIGYQPSFAELRDPQYDENKTTKHGKIFTLTSDKTGDGKTDVNDLEWQYLDGDGDFRSNEVVELCNEADIIITNPPFSLFREFFVWIVEADKKFVIMGSLNQINNKEVFPLILNDEVWLGSKSQGSIYFSTPNPKTGLVKFGNICWFTNLDHGRRKQLLPLMTMADNLKYSKHEKIRGQEAYKVYDNYDAIEVPFVDSIPSDYNGVMGVPISFLNKYNPDQFEILGVTQRGCHDEVPDTKKYNDYWEVRQNGERTGSSGGKTNENANLLGNDGRKNYFINKDGRIIQSAYGRIFIRHRKTKK